MHYSEKIGCKVKEKRSCSPTWGCTVFLTVSLQANLPTGQRSYAVQPRAALAFLPSSPAHIVKANVISSRKGQFSLLPRHLPCNLLVVETVIPLYPIRTASHYISPSNIVQESCYHSLLLRCSIMSPNPLPYVEGPRLYRYTDSDHGPLILLASYLGLTLMLLFILLQLAVKFTSARPWGSDDSLIIFATVSSFCL
jgi:hypothetical protein